ncbi:MAG: WecB/TagA/CpsF family glycosyltransferase [Cyanobacteria bacterium]|nr:WecB/TagA/CpsF family glycosyltransferase [Cyanobacteriota bacterium]
MKKVRVLNVEIDNIALKPLLETLGDRGGVVYTPNVDHLVKLRYDRDLFRAYQAADYLTCDSQILMFAARLLGAPICEKISGSDLLPALYRYYAADDHITLFLLGAAEGVAARARDHINGQVGREMVVDVYSPPYGFEKDEAECEAIVERVNRSGATVLAVGLGAPKQEKWIYHYRDRLPQVKTFLAIGASIDFEAGQVARAPRWMSNCGLEWAFRLCSEPRRLWRRYLVESLPFFGEILRQKLGCYDYRIPNGELFVRLGLMTVNQLQMVLDLQEQQPQPYLRFGEIVVVRGWLPHQTVEFFSEQLVDLPQRAGATLLGVLLEAGLLSAEQGAEAQRAAEAEGISAEAAAIARGWVSAVTVSFLKRALVEGYPAIPLGFTLQQAGLLTTRQVATVRDWQQHPRRLRFGDWIVLKGWANRAMVEYMLTEVPRLIGRLPPTASVDDYLATAIQPHLERLFQQGPPAALAARQHFERRGGDRDRGRSRASSSQR